MSPLALFTIFVHRAQGSTGSTTWNTHSLASAICNDSCSHWHFFSSIFIYRYIYIYLNSRLMRKQRYNLNVWLQRLFPTLATIVFTYSPRVKTNVTVVVPRVQTEERNWIDHFYLRYHTRSLLHHFVSTRPLLQSHWRVHCLENAARGCRQHCTTASDILLLFCSLGLAKYCIVPQQGIENMGRPAHQTECLDVKCELVGQEYSGKKCHGCCQLIQDGWKFILQQQHVSII